ncbi:MAG: aldo/keto reductase [Mycobacteriales bacterium]
MTGRAVHRFGLARSGLSITRLGLGTAPLGNLFQEVDDDSARGTFRAAWLAGVRYFDTAPHYGLGLAELRLGDAVRTFGWSRDDLVISTKVGRLLEPVLPVVGTDSANGFDVPRTHQRRWDFTPKGIRRSLDESCERLGVEHIDIAFIHDPDSHMDQAMGEAYQTLRALRAEGRVTAIGAGMNSAALLARLVAECDLDVVMLAGRYSLLDQSALDELLPAALQRGTDVIVAGVFNSGILAQHPPDSNATYAYSPATPEIVERARRLAAVCEEFGVALPQAALQFPLGHPAVAAIALGARSPNEVAANIELAAATVPDQLWVRMIQLGLIRDDAPLPSS